MGFFSGRLSFARFRVDGQAPGMFGPEHLERLEAFQIGNVEEDVAWGSE